MDLSFIALNVQYGDTQQHGQTASKRQIQMLLPFTGFNHLVILPRYPQLVRHILLRKPFFCAKLNQVISQLLLTSLPHIVA